MYPSTMLLPSATKKLEGVYSNISNRVTLLFI